MRARLLLLAVALAAFGGSLFAGFHLDDYATFSDPLQLVGSVLRVWPHPLTRLLNWVNFQIAGQEPMGYHAANLLLHLGALLLAYECLRRILPATAAVLAAAIFAVHPLQAEAVDYVSARGAILAAILCFAALLEWISGRPWIAVAAFAGALLADERCALFPLVWLMARSVRTRGDVTGLSACAAMALATAVRAHTATYAYALVALRFLRLFVLPWGFTIAPDVREPLWLAGAAAIAIGGVVLWRWRKLRVDSEWSWVAMGLLLLIPSFSANPAADSRAYLPLFAFAAAMGLLLARVPARVLAVGAVAILVAVSVSRTYVWLSEERLWREAVRRAPGLVEPKIQLAKHLHAGEALELLNRAREQDPHDSEIPAEIGKVLLDEQQYDGAVDELSHAIALNPKNALAFNNRGVALAAMGQLPAAAADFGRALELDPHLTEARENLKRLGAR